MRIIKFRGKDATGRKGWVYGDLVHNQRVTKTGLEPRVMVGGYEVIPETVGQFTGLLDNHGKKVFEGDIVKRISVDSDSSKNYDCGFVIFDDGDASFKLSMYKCVFNGRNIGLLEDDDDVTCNFVTNVVYDGQTPQEDEYFYEVIGNTYDNPEFLNE